MESPLILFGVGK